jgi:hypothetical protein
VESYIPVGIEEAPREGGEAPAGRAKPTQQASHGIQEMQSVRGGAKHTLAGLRAFEWSSLLLTLSSYLALGAIAALAGASYGSLDLGTVGLLSLAGLVVGLLAFALFLGAAFFALQGFRFSYRGRNELGPLQKKEVEAAGRYFWRGVFVLVISGTGAAAVGLQEGTPLRLAGIPYATSIALLIALVGGFFASFYFAAFFARYLRNLSPGGSKKARRRFRALFVLAATLPIALTVAGVPFVMLDNDYACAYGVHCGDELWMLGSPSFGPGYHLHRHLMVDGGFSTYEAAALVVVGLLVSRLLALLALRSYRKQLQTAELVLRARIRQNAPPAVSTA